MWKVFKCSKVGTRNKENGLKCQDYVHYLEKEPIQVIALADGTGEDNFAGIGAEHSCKTLAKLLAEHFEDLYNMEKSLVQFNVITNVQTELYELCSKYGVDIENLHSTLLGLVIDNEKEQFMAIHLGDGSIGIKKNEKIITMSYPENGVNKSETYLTSNHKVGKHVRIYRGDIKEIKEFILVSDGWNEKLGGKNQFIQEELLEKAEDSIYVDDVSFIALRRE